MYGSGAPVPVCKDRKCKKKYEDAVKGEKVLIENANTAVIRGT